MASTEAGAVQWLNTLGGLQLAQLQALVQASGWNQLDADWQHFFRFGRIAVCHDSQGRIVASGAILPLGGQVTWISMILVRPEARGQGLGGQIFEACLKEARADGRTACLDATPQGERLYLHHGFAPTKPLTHITRWRREAVPTEGAQGTPVASDSPDACAVEALAAMDTASLGAPRTSLLADLLWRPGSRCVRVDQGWALVRQGRIAQHIGPILAPDETTAIAVLERTLQGEAEAMFIDMPQLRPAFAQALERSGFSAQRDFTRMSLGDSPPAALAHQIYAIAGPEYG